MATVVQIGAGAIGRGFLGQLWSEAGFETVFVDVNDALIGELNRRGNYTLRLVGTDSETTRRIAPVRAIHADDTDAVVSALASCVFATTAVGARHLAGVARTLVAPALLQRDSPLNVLLCENGMSIRESFLAGMGENPGVHAVETVVGRMVPESGGETDALTVSAEPYHELPFNRSQWHGNPPDIPGLVPVPGDQFPAYELRKLYLHNGGHALLAYHGYRRGYRTIRECAEEKVIVEELRDFWKEVADALRRSEHGRASIFARGSLESFTGDLLQRFRNPHLGDTVLRVARDPLRKLAPEERLSGAASFCQRHGVLPVFGCRAIAAALRFDPPDDAEAQTIQRSLREHGIGETVFRYTGIEPNSPLSGFIEKEFARQRQK